MYGHIKHIQIINHQQFTMKEFSDVKIVKQILKLIHKSKKY